MNYYPHHIGDFRSGTVNMSRQARWIYRDMIDVYYDTEKPLPLDLDVLCDLIGVETDEEIKVVERLLRFKFTKTDEGYLHERCEVEIAKFHAKAVKAKENGKLGGRPPKAKPIETVSEPKITNPVSVANPDLTGSEANQEPRTNNQEPQKEKPKARPADAVAFELPEFIPADAWKAYAEMRAKIRKPMTAHARDLIVKSLRRMHEVGIDIEVVLNNSTLQCWTNVYPPKADFLRAPARAAGVSPTQLSDINAEAKRLLFGRQTQEVIDV